MHKRIECKREKTRQKVEVGEVFRASCSSNSSSERATTNWCYKVDTLTKIVREIVPSCSLDLLLKDILEFFEEDNFNKNTK